MVTSFRSHSFHLDHSSLGGTECWCKGKLSYKHLAFVAVSLWPTALWAMSATHELLKHRFGPCNMQRTICRHVCIKGAIWLLAFLVVTCTVFVVASTSFTTCCARASWEGTAVSMVKLCATTDTNVSCCCHLGDMISVTEEFSQAATHDDPYTNTEANRGMYVQTTTWEATCQADDVQCGFDGFKLTDCAKNSKSYRVFPHDVRKRRASVCRTTSHELVFNQSSCNHLASMVWIIWS